MRARMKTMAALALLGVASGCSTVRPTHRAILADPIMQVEADPEQAELLRHALDNREGARGGAGVSGGGCGCN